MGVPEAVLAKVGSLPDISSMSKDDLAVLCKKLYEQSCAVFGEKFDVEYQVKKKDMEIHNLEMETSESHGTFKIPKLKKVWQQTFNNDSYKVFRSPVEFQVNRCQK